MHLFRRKYKDKNGISKEYHTWTCKYYVYGKQKYFNTKETNKQKAKEKAMAYIADVRKGGEPWQYNKIEYCDLKQMLILDYEINDRKSIERMMHSVNALNEHFEGYKAQSITTDEIKRYIKKRKDAKKANATINRELSALKRMFNLARQNSPPKVAQVPHIPMLKENNKRTGFFEHQEYQLLLKAITPYMKGVIILAYETGMRKEEILSLKWDQVDMKRKTIRIEDTKTDEPRVLEISPAMNSQLLYYKQRNLGLGINNKYVFLNRDYTDRIRDFRGAWNAACKKAGLGKRHFHDFRRTAIRNMVRAGVADNIAMKISGHKTRAVFDRYNIVNTKDIKEAMEKTHKYLMGQRKEANLQVIDIDNKIRRMENQKNIRMYKPK